MSISPIITRGFGSYANVNYLPTRGYLSLVVISMIGNVNIANKPQYNLGLADIALYNLTISDKPLNNADLADI
jgi:hypothetical protein